jgi:hypothetical protein
MILQRTLTLALSVSYIGRYSLQLTPSTGREDTLVSTTGMSLQLECPKVWLCITQKSPH